MLTNLYKYNYSIFGNFVNDKVSFSVIYFNIYFERLDMTTFERIKKLADKQKISLKELAIKLGFSENNIYRWKTSKPKGEDLAKIADYFHVSVDYLLGREDIEKIKEPVDLKDIVSDHVKFEDVNWDEWLSFGGKPLTEKDKMLLFATFYNRDEK